MLKSIYIKNYILIDELEQEFSGGLNIITGETGAGKSILINAIDIAFGAKAGKEVIKTGAEKAIIELTILNTKHNVNKLFEEYGIDNNGEEIVLSKEISQTSSRSKVNGCLVNQEFLKILREMFLDIHSQHQAYTFLQSKYHINLLDAYIKNPLLEIYKKEYEEYKNLISELENLKNVSQKTEEQIDFLKFQVEEIERANVLSINEDDELNNELTVLENAEKLKELTGSSYWAIAGDDGSIIDALYEIKTFLSKACTMDNSLENYEGELIGIIDSIKALSSSLNEYSASMESDTAKIDSIQERLFILDKLKRKYGGNLENVLKNYEKLKIELDSIDNSTKNIEEISQRIIVVENDLKEKAIRISEERQRQAKILSEYIVQKLEKLELPKVKFQIGFEQTELSQVGIDKVEFLISTNISEGLKQDLRHKLQMAIEQNTNPKDTLYSVADALVTTYNPQHTLGSSKSKVVMATTLTRRFELEKDDADKLRVAMLLYDVGNLMLPQEILQKDGPLTDEERNYIENHPMIAAHDILEPIATVKDKIPIIEKHHENWDGSGYPNKLAGNDIPLSSQIILIIDTI